jgi:hypothetical protein
VADLKPGDPDRDPLLGELTTLVQGAVVEVLLEQRDAVPKLLEQLPRGLRKEEQRAWELSGLHLSRQRRFHEALAIFEAWYRNIVDHQATSDHRLHKGAPLVWIRDQHVNLEHTALAQRFMMLTLIEDALAGEGTIDPARTGSYFRFVWYHGLSDSQFRRYAGEIAAFGREHSVDARYPERVLQELDKLWMTEFPATAEALLYPANWRYVAALLARTGDGTGQALELLADYLLSVMPGCRTYRRKRSHSTTTTSSARSTESISISAPSLVDTSCANPKTGAGQPISPPSPNLPEFLIRQRAALGSCFRARASQASDAAETLRANSSSYFRIEES